MTLTREQSSRLRDLALGDPAVVAQMLSGAGATDGALEPAAVGLVRVASLIATAADTAAYLREVNAAIAAGASPTQVIEVLTQVAPMVGSTRAISAAFSLALALGYDVDAALESLEAEDR